jgi:excisionase family DNA binding protein
MRNRPTLPLDLLQRYTVNESLEYLRIGRATFYKKVAAGQITLIKDGKRSYVSGRSIAAQSAA